MNAHTRHRRHNSHPGFSQLLTTVLGSPFLTTTDLPELVDGAPVFVPHDQTVTRPPSPTPTVDSSSFSFIHSAANSSPNRPLKSILPRIWDVISPSRTYPGGFKTHDSRFIDYSELAPLDGEEGELIAIDDEACFFMDLTYGSRAVTGIDILALLPTELALHILVLICTTSATSSESLSTILACRAVSHTWQTLSLDNTVWRALFVARWNVDLTRRTTRRKLPPPPPPPPVESLYDSPPATPILETPPTGKSRSGMGIAASMSMSMSIKKRKMKKFLTIDGGNSSQSSIPRRFFHSSAGPSRSSTSSSTSTPPHRRFFTQTSIKPRPRLPSVLLPSPSATRPRTKSYFNQRTFHPRSASTPNPLSRLSQSSIVLPEIDRARKLTEAPLQLDWHEMYRARLELDRRWAGTAYVKPSTVDDFSQRQHLPHFIPQHALPDPAPAPVPFTPKVTKIAGHVDSVYCVEFDTRRIITGSRDRSIRVWSLRDGRLLGCFGVPVAAGANAHAQAQAAGLGPAVQGEEPQMRIQGHIGSVLCLKFSADWDAEEGDDGEGAEDVRRLGFMVSGSSDCTVCVWDLWTGKRLEVAGDVDEQDGRVEREVKGKVRAVLRGHAGGVLDIRIDQNWIVSCSKDALIRVWDRKTLALVRTLRGHEGPVNAVGLQHGRVVSASGDGKMILWDLGNGERMRTFEGHDRGLACIEFKDELIVSGSNDCKIKVWSAATGECLRTLVGHQSLVRALAFDPKTRRLVSASYDKSVKVWDLDSGKLVREFKNMHSSNIFDVKFDATRIISSSHDHQIAVIDFSQNLDTSLFV
ncbi:hypothetical protein H0H81_005099 [Sphagnurus paluster]|uniref:F-box domain-containing protein n=1 Tax=Sphagnurus paluster TaxID=117069 RepID=A0A9P7GS22_9AGAR|nr:hypothetical protein H0H81_005099 [Sphagnurus paluster]